MSDNINQMNYKQLRNEVQLLRDELAIMQRKFEDIIYNLDTDNFSSRFVKEQGNMKTAIEVNANGIKTKVSKEEMETFKESTLTQTAEQIKVEVEKVNTATDNKLKNYATTDWTAEKISSTVTKEFVTDLIDGEYVTDATFKSQFDMYANGIYATVEETYETKSDANSSYSNLRSSISSVSQTANSIETKVGKLENGQYGNYTLFKQTDDTFLFDGDYMRISSAIMLTDDSGNHTFSIFHNEGNGVSAGRRGTYMCGVSLNLATPDPLMIGASNQSVYLYDAVEDNLIATRGWVLDNAGAGGGTVVAVFG